MAKRMKKLTLAQQRMLKTIEFMGSRFSTMIVALQLYFETIYKEGMAPHVTSVGLAKDVNCFEVRLTEPLEQVFEREAK